MWDSVGPLCVTIFKNTSKVDHQEDGLSAVDSFDKGGVYNLTSMLPQKDIMLTPSQTSLRQLGSAFLPSLNGIIWNAAFGVRPLSTMYVRGTLC